MSINSKFVCLYINEDNPHETHYWIFDNSLTQIRGDTNIIHPYIGVHGQYMIEPFSDTWDMDFKLKKLSDDKFILAMIKHYELYTLIININTSNYLTKVAPTKILMQLIIVFKILIMFLLLIFQVILLVLLVKIKMIKFYFSYISISGSSLNLVTSLSLSDSSSFSNLNLVGLQRKDIGFF